MTRPLRITSRQNPRIKDVLALRDSRERERRGQFIIDGSREIARAIDAGVKLVQSFVCDELCRSAESRRAFQKSISTKAEVFEVSEEVFGKLAFGDRHDGVIAVAEASRRKIGESRLPVNPVVAILDGLEKPGNVGAILRSADAAGVDAIIIADGRTDLYNPNTIRASLGTVFRSNVYQASVLETIEWLRSKDLPVIAARPDAENLYTDIDFRSGVAIVLGSEAKGLSNTWTSTSCTPVRLPMHGIADSLNVSTTAAVLFYEALRQRG